MPWSSEGEKTRKRFTILRRRAKSEWPKEGTKAQMSFADLLCVCASLWW